MKAFEFLDLFKNLTEEQKKFDIIIGDYREDEDRPMTDFIIDHIFHAGEQIYLEGREKGKK